MLNHPKRTVVLGGVLVLGLACAFLMLKKGTPGNGSGSNVASSDAPTIGTTIPGTPGLVEPRQPSQGTGVPSGSDQPSGESAPQALGQAAVGMSVPGGKQLPSGVVGGSPSVAGQPGVPVAGSQVMRAQPTGTQQTGSAQTGSPQAGGSLQGGSVQTAALTPGLPQGSVTGSAVVQPKPEPPKDACFTVSYRHKHKNGASGGACSHHKNLIRVKAPEGLKFNPKTVCIRVNGTPVKFTPAKGKSTEFVIGTVVGTNTQVTARYCTGKLSCNENCKVPKDDFVAAIGGNEMDTTDKEQLAIAVWDKEDPNEKGVEDAKLQKDMHKELKDLDEVAKAAAEGYTLFSDWVPETEAPACLSGKAEGPSESDRKMAATGGRS
jgi:hypothetical protein